LYRNENDFCCTDYDGVDNGYDKVLSKVVWVNHESLNPRIFWFGSPGMFAIAGPAPRILFALGNKHC